MRRLFLRTYVVLAAVVLAGLAVAGAWEAARRSPPQPELIEALLAAPDDVRAAFASAEPEQARRKLEQDLGADIRVLPLDPLPPLPPPLRSRLQRGRVVGPGPGGRAELWVPLQEQGLLVHVVPPGRRPPPVPWIAAFVLVGLGVAVATQLLPLDRDLQRLANAAAAFGSGERDVRVRLPASAAAGELGARFDAMADRISELLRAREELLAAVSHELRTPLNRVRFAAELLADEADPAARAEQAEALQRDLDELDALVGELLAWGRLDAGGLELEAVALGPMVDELLAGLDAVRAGDLTVRADRALIRRALGNLITNAARHARSQVAVTLEPGAIHVDDDGAGIPEADRQRVLEPFVRLDAARDRDAGGVGLGLALVDRIARAHGGSVRIADSPLGGARVTLTLADTG